MRGCTRSRVSPPLVPPAFQPAKKRYAQGGLNRSESYQPSFWMSFRREIMSRIHYSARGCVGPPTLLRELLAGIHICGWPLMGLSVTSGGTSIERFLGQCAKPGLRSARGRGPIATTLHPVDPARKLSNSLRSEPLTARLSLPFESICVGAFIGIIQPP